MSSVTREDVIQQLSTILQEEKKLDVTKLSLDNKLTELGIDSFGFLEIIFGIEHYYDIKFPQEFGDIKTLNDVVDVTYNLILNKDKAA